MDFFNIPKLIEQGVYDVMMWILFFPLTVLRMIVSPRRTLRYVREQAALDPDTAFSDAMRPALFLAIAIILGSFISPDDIDVLRATTSSALGKMVYGSWTSITAFSMIALCLVPLVGALLLDLLTPGKVSRESLRVPFDQQCYIGAPSILVLTLLGGIGPSLLGIAASGIAAAAALAWVVVVEYFYFRDNSELRPLVCMALVLATLFGGLVLIVLAALLVTGVTR
jgi:hypothetical protein